MVDEVRQTAPSVDFFNRVANALRQRIRTAAEHTYFRNLKFKAQLLVRLEMINFEEAGKGMNKFFDRVGEVDFLMG